LKTSCFGLNPVVEQGDLILRPAIKSKDIVDKVLKVLNDYYYKGTVTFVYPTAMYRYMVGEEGAELEHEDATETKPACKPEYKQIYQEENLVTVNFYCEDIEGEFESIRIGHDCYIINGNSVLLLDYFYEDSKDEVIDNFSGIRVHADRGGYHFGHDIFQLERARKSVIKYLGSVARRFPIHFHCGDKHLVYVYKSGKYVVDSSKDNEMHEGNTPSKETLQKWAERMRHKHGPTAVKIAAPGQSFTLGEIFYVSPNGSITQNLSDANEIEEEQNEESDTFSIAQIEDIEKLCRHICEEQIEALKEEPLGNEVYLVERVSFLGNREVIAAYTDSKKASDRAIDETTECSQQGCHFAVRLFRSNE
jgi:hypothetical protein